MRHPVNSECPWIGPPSIARCPPSADVMTRRLCRRCTSSSEPSRTAPLPRHLITEPSATPLWQASRITRMWRAGRRATSLSQLSSRSQVAAWPSAGSPSIGIKKPVSTGPLCSVRVRVWPWPAKNRTRLSSLWSAARSSVTSRRIASPVAAPSVNGATICSKPSRWNTASAPFASLTALSSAGQAQYRSIPTTVTNLRPAAIPASEGNALVTSRYAITALATALADNYIGLGLRRGGMARVSRQPRVIRSRDANARRVYAFSWALCRYALHTPSTARAAPRRPR